LCTGIPKSHQFHYDAVGAGHYGIFSGRRWREQVYPEVQQFIERHSGGSAAPSTSRPAAKRRNGAASKSTRK
jgi:poly(3-hydroxybutyrate) depolymerase